MESPHKRIQYPSRSQAMLPSIWHMTTSYFLIWFEYKWCGGVSFPVPQTPGSIIYAKHGPCHYDHPLIVGLICQQVSWNLGERETISPYWRNSSDSKLGKARLRH